MDTVIKWRKENKKYSLFALFVKNQEIIIIIIVKAAMRCDVFGLKYMLKIKLGHTVCTPRGGSNKKAISLSHKLQIF